jgi:hypothetical protein
MPLIATGIVDVFEEFAPSSQAPEIRLQLVGAKYKAQQRDKHKPRAPFSRQKQRVAELKRLFKVRYPLGMPDDDAGHDDLWLMMNAISNYDERVAWAGVNAAWLSSAEIDAMAREIGHRPLWLTAREMGDRLGVTEAERTKHKMKTIRAAGMTDEMMKARVQQNDRNRKKAERAAARDARPPTISETKPWLAEGVSRATWHRRRKDRAERETKSVQSNTSPIILDGICLTTPAVAGTHPSHDSLQEKKREVRVDGNAVVGCPERRYGTRFPTAMRLNREQIGYARAAGFDYCDIDRMLEMMRDHALARRSYSLDWGAAWFNWIDRQVGIDSERDRLARRRNRLLAASHQPDARLWRENKRKA